MRHKFYDFKKNYLKISIISFFICFITILNILVIKNKGFEKRFPEILVDITKEDQAWTLLKVNNSTCHNKKGGCNFIIEKLKRKVFIIGDSVAGSIIYDLKNKLEKENLNFVSYTSDGCLFFPGLNMINEKKLKKNCDKKYFKEIIDDINDNQKQKNIIIFFARYSLYFDKNINKIFVNNFDQSTPNSFRDHEKSFKSIISDLGKKNHIIIIYPFFETINVKKKFLKIYLNDRYEFQNRINNSEIITASKKKYFEKNQYIFNFLNTIKGNNIHRIYPHKIFCETSFNDKCHLHNNKNIFTHDGIHPSFSGSEKINSLIISMIKNFDQL